MERFRFEQALGVAGETGKPSAAVHGVARVGHN